jgi:hypothetical protein
MQKALIFLCLMGLYLAGCKSDSNDPAPVTQTKTQLITKTWQMQAATGTIISTGLTVPVYQKGGTGNLIDYSKYQLALTSDGKFSLNDGTQTQTGTWQLTTNDTQLVLTYAGTPATVVTYTVDTASATNLDLSYQISSTTQSAAEKGYLATAQGLGFDTSKGIKISTKLVPL